MSTVERLRTVADEITPRLEHVFATPPFSSISEQPPPEHLVLRDGWCVAAAGLLGNYLRKNHGLRAESLTTQYLIERPGYESEVFKHTILEVWDEGDTQPTWIDATWGQMYLTIGMGVQDVLENPTLQAEYPDEKIAVFDPHKEDFARQVAEALHRTDEKGIITTQESVFDVLRRTSLDHKRRVCRELWLPARYQPAPLDPTMKMFIDGVAEKL